MLISALSSSFVVSGVSTAMHHGQSCCVQVGILPHGGSSVCPLFGSVTVCHLGINPESIDRCCNGRNVVMGEVFLFVH